MNNKSICHISSVHSRYDSRIFRKECIGLSKNKFKVYLIVADGKQDELKERVSILNIKKSSKSISRLKRIVLIPRLIEKKVLEINPELVHFHDPELIPLGLRLKLKGFVVVADFHEDIPLQILTKPYLNFFLRKIASFAFKTYQRYAIKKLSAIVSATPSIAQTLIKYNPKNIVVKNYPIIDKTIRNNSSKNNWITYIGGISVIRGFYEIIEAAEASNTRLKIAGVFHEPKLHDVIKRDEYAFCVDFLGFLDKEQIDKLLSESIAGLVTLYPTSNFQDSLPIKLFEYMSAGLPVIASNFPLWKDIVEKNNCGLCVNPKDPKAIADAINYLVENPKEAQEMGNNGRQAVVKRYNWEIEEKKLINLYNSLLK